MNTGKDNLIEQATHFAFGENWAAYAQKITEVHIEQATKDLKRLIPGALGKRFLDIGCGSGLHSIAALNLGAEEVLAVDIDPDSVKTTKAVLEKYAPEGKVWRVEEISVFDLQPEQIGLFETVYSWGVLHHTGDMERAIRCAAALCSSGGKFVFALYRRTWMDWLWKIEKKWYAKASPDAQKRAQNVYITLAKIKFFVTGRSWKRYVTEYVQKRGMDFFHDLHDWLGGWPYETISPEEVDVYMRQLGYSPISAIASRGDLFGKPLGILGSGCNEYVYQRF